LEIFVSDGEGGHAPARPQEPLYGETYLPRKFKIGIAHPNDNAVDILTQDIGLMPVPGSDGAFDGEKFDLYTGGGLGLTHNNPATAAHLGLYLGRLRRDQVVAACRSIATLQRENGERRDRRQARWKYTIRRLGVGAVKDELKTRFGIELEPATPEPLPPMDLHLGFRPQRDGRHSCGISVESGRVGPRLRKAVLEAVTNFGLGVRLTPQQDLMLTNIEDVEAVKALLDQHGVRQPEAISLARRNAMACPAKPTCGLAMTDAEQILPHYLDAIEAEGLGDVDVVIRMTGCPNNCARPPSAEIGIYGYGKNDHVILVGGSRAGTRLAHTLFPRISGEQMVPALVGLFRAIRDHNPEGLPAGDFLHQTDPATLRDWIGIEDAR
ncbi:MAG: NADPH-dependent assimilatory sulfite reductase hemoprotein subunit, partial [Proteobacteria bacterium]|nr:NADPH-dependent assimilatory sulfite reductase hemoprotein subunit [Pseudomonadota bacterium]